MLFYVIIKLQNIKGMVQLIIPLIHSFSGICKKIKQEVGKMEDDDLSQTNSN